ncbi:MAG TPA: putative 2OG-Fe(II) oxygenase [Vitreimonas sp.]|nr:putative 2OG-Fe(II) oxygenase [Vitreimonas sp.]
MTPDEIQNLKKAARLALQSGQVEDAERAARRLIFEAPSAESYDILSCALRNQERFDEALAASNQALVLDPRNAPAMHNRALVLARVGRTEEALRVYDTLVGGGLRAAPLWLNRGVALMDLARVDEAEKWLADGVRSWPADAGLQNALAMVRWTRTGAPDFASAFERAVEANPDAVAARLRCADLLRRAGFTEKSEAMLRAGLARAPDTAMLLASLGTLLDEADRTEEALPFLRRAVALAPRVAIFDAALANALLRQGQGDEALKFILPWRAAQPVNQEWICYETTALRQIGEARYRELCDYELMVRPYDVEAPAGYANMAAFNEALSASLMRLHVLDAYPLDQSLRNGSQTTRNLTQVADPVVKAYIAALDAPIRAYMDQMRAHARIHPNHPWSGRVTGGYRIAGAWSVRLKANGFHVNHFHPAGWISSAYYVSLPPAVSRDDNAQQGWIKFGEPRWPTPGCGIERVVQPKEGRLVLFPSYMWHGTIAFDAGERLTAPFDAVPV